MKKKIAIWCIGFVCATTFLSSFAQPSVFQQLAVWAGGCFAVLVALALFVVGNWPQASQQPTKAAWKTAAPECREDQAVIAAVKAMRQYRMDDSAISQLLGLDIDVVRSIP